MVSASERGIGVAVMTSVSASSAQLGGLLAQQLALVHAEAVLLVDHHQPQPGVAQLLHDQRMGADQDVAAAVGHRLVDPLALALAHPAGRAGAIVESGGSRGGVRLRQGLERGQLRAERHRRGEDPSRS